MKEQDSKVEQSSTTKLSRRSFLKGSVAVAAGGRARELIRDLEGEIIKALRDAGF